MRGFFKNRPACGRKNTPGQRIWAIGEDGIEFPIRTRAQRTFQYSMDHLVLKTGWIRFNHRLERKRRAL